MYKQYLLIPIVSAVIFITLLSASLFEVFDDDELDVAYWVWRPSDLEIVDMAKHLIIYQGDFMHVDGSYIFNKRNVQPHASCCTGDVSLLVRVYNLPKNESEFIFLVNQIEYLIKQWEKQGVDIEGIQIDHDSPASRLAGYADFLGALTKLYSNSYLSITGLSSWLTDNEKELERIAESVDYIAFQLYQKYNPIKDYKRYLYILDNNYDYNYKLGITRSLGFNALHVPSDATKKRKFQGLVVFLNETESK